MVINRKVPALIVRASGLCRSGGETVPPGDIGKFGDVFDVTTWGTGLAVGMARVQTRDILQCTGQPGTSKNYLVQSCHVAEVM